MFAFAGQTEDPESASESVIAGDYFGAGGNLAPATAVEGDAFVVGGQVALRVPVAGDAVLSGGSVTVADRVGEDLYAAGGSVVVDAPVGHNARIAGGQVEITRRAQVSGKTTIAGGRVTVQGAIGRQLVVFGEHVLLDGAVAGNVTVAARTLSVGPNARIDGRLTFRGSVPAQVDPAAVVSGGIGYLTFDFETETYQPVARAIAWAGAITFTAGLFLIGVLAILLMPESTAANGRLLRSRPIAALGLGFAMIVCVPVAAVLLMLTIIGIPFAFVMLLLWPVMLIFGYLAGVMSAGDGMAGLISRDKAAGRGLRVVLLAAVLAAMLVLSKLPIAGWLLGMLLMTAGVGAMTLYVFGRKTPA